MYQEKIPLLAKLYKTDEQVINCVRSFFSDERQILIDDLEEKIASKNTIIKKIQSKISQKESSQKTVHTTLRNDLANLFSKRDFFLKVYTFSRKLSKKDWTNIRT